MLKKIKVVVLLASIIALTIITPYAFSYELRINCGGEGYTAIDGDVYIADQEYTPANGAGYAGGSSGSSETAMGGTEDDVLYQSERWGNFSYLFDLPNDCYKVKFQFSENYWSEPAKRVFSVWLEDTLALNNLDIYALVGDFYALDYEFLTAVTDGQLNITSTATADFPKFSTISVITAEPDAVPPTAPANLSAKAGDKDIFLDWDDNTEIDLRGYNLYRSVTQGSGYNLVNTELLHNSKYLDEDVVNGTTYYYIVNAVDASNNESIGSNEVSIQPNLRDYFPIPACAWKRVIGDIPLNVQSSCPDRGVALGGFGAGSFMYSISGAFGPWAMDIAEYNQYWLEEGAFHIYEKKGAEPPRIKCLSTNKNMEAAWDKIGIGDGRYYALQPKGWSTYNCFAADVSQKFFSPIIARNYKETSYPVAVWQFKFSNPTSQNLELALMFTWPNAIYSNQTRTGFNNSLKTLNNITGIVLKATDPNNTPETQDSEWCIATKADETTTISYVASWNKDADGEDIWNDFADDGILSNTKLDNSQSAGAIAIKINLAPGTSKVVPIVLSWDFPVTKFRNAEGDGTEWWKKYCEYFDRNSDNSFEIAVEALNNYGYWETRVDEWMSPVINSDKYSQWLKMAAFNELYYNQFGGVFYESGLKSGHQQEYMGLHEEDHKFFVMECRSYRFANTLDVRHYSSVIYARLWPEIERDVLKSFADAIEYYDPIDHQTPHDVGSSDDDPYFGFDCYGTRFKHWKDLHSKFIQQCWRYYYLNNDGEFLDYVWPACKDTYGFMKTTDTDGDFLPNNYGSDNTYDVWGLYGTSILCGGLWVGALEAMEQMAIIQNDPILNEVQTWLANARANLDYQLWDEAKSYYHIDTQGPNPTAIMSDGLNGQRYCEAYGLADILPRDKMKSHLQQVYNRCVVPLKDFTGDGIGDVGAINGKKEDGSNLSIGQSDEIWVGSTYFLAASMYYAGLTTEAFNTAFGVYYPVYSKESLGYWFNTPEAWWDGGINPRPKCPEQYQRPRAVWEFIFEIDNPYPYDTTPPAKVMGLTVTSINSHQLDLLWVANTEEDLSCYNVYRSLTSNSGYALIASPTTNSYSDIGLEDLTTYYYKVSAVDFSANEGEASDEASATTKEFLTLTEDKANQDRPVQNGGISGSYLNTYSNNGSYEAISERESLGKRANRYSYLEHKWTVEVAGGDVITFYLDAYHTPNSEGDDFVFAYSTDDITYIDMLTVTKTADDDNYQTYELPNAISGTVYVRVKDTDRTRGNRYLDIIYIDHMYILSQTMPASKPQSRGFAQVSGRKILIDGTPFTIKGVGYSPIPVGSELGYDFCSNPDIYNRDFALLRLMHCNTIRTWDKVTDTAFLDAAYNNGVEPIYVIMGFSVDESLNYADPFVRQNIIDEFKQYVSTYKDYPAVLMWSIGNEQNYGYKGDIRDWYTLINDLAKAAYRIEGKTYHPVTTPNGDVWNSTGPIGEPGFKTDDVSMNYLDVWGANIYSGWNFQGRIQYYGAVSAKPFWISEYGFPGTDQRNQAEGADALWTEMITNSYICSGGTIMEYSDEWWKSGSPETHEDSFGAEFWGIVGIEDNGSNSDIVHPKTAYYILQDRWSRGTKKNLAYGKEVFASSIENENYIANKAVDGNYNTRWSSEPNDPQWLYVDLGAEHSIGCIILRWESAYATAYEIQISDDATNWTTVYSTSSGDWGTEFIYFDDTPITARYVKMLGTKRATGWGYSLWEFEVYEPMVNNAAKGKEVFASSIENENYIANKAVDGNYNTRWSSEPGDPQWLYVDLGAEYEISKVVLRWETTYGKAYKIQKSFDVLEWVDVYSTINSDGKDDYIIFDSPFIARYIRMLGTERATSYGYSLWEFEVIGKVVSLEMPTTAFASSSEGPDFGPEKAIDNDTTTRWSSNFSDNEWIHIDFGIAKSFNTVNLNWEAAYGKQYEIQISDNATNWITIYTEDNSDGGIDSIDVGSQTARYVKMQGIQRATSYGYSLWEFGVSKESPSMTATASSVEYPDLGPEKAIDGDLTTRWSSNRNDNEWIYIDFAIPKTFNTVILNWEAGYGKSYQLQISDDAIAWTTIYSTTTGDGGIDTISVGAQTARYLKMQGIQRGTEWGYSLWEFSVQ